MGQDPDWTWMLPVKCLQGGVCETRLFDFTGSDDPGVVRCRATRLSERASAEGWLRCSIIGSE